jgi:uncharacterized protein
VVTAPLRLTRVQARRLAYRGQRLAGPRPGRTRAELLELVRRLGCLQLDPISVVARSHQLVVWSRVGRFDPVTLQRLQERDRALFEYWAHAASLVPSTDLALHRFRMQRVTEPSRRAGLRRIQDWLEANSSARRALLGELEANGPLRTQDLRAYALVPWANGGWSDERSVALLLEVLSQQGVVAVSRRDGSTRWWDLIERCLPPDAPTTTLSETEAVRTAALRSVQALGVATPTQINRHFTRNCYPGLPGVLARLVAEGELVPATVEGQRGRWYLHARDADTLAELAPARLSLLSPFDNLICDRARTEDLWDVEFRLEIYTPVAKRRWGYYVLAVLDGDRLVGRIDAATDPARGELVARAVHHDGGRPWGARRRQAVARRFEDLARFIGATGVSDPTGGLGRG